MKAEVGDKVRVKAGTNTGSRGVIERIDGATLLVRMDGLGLKVRVKPEEITNFSLAARKAWQSEPDRAVGRKKGTKLYDRVSVTLRFDRDLWERFQALEQKGIIDDRTGLINSWFREKLAGLAPGGNLS